MEKQTKEDFFRNIENYVLVGNNILRRDYDNPTKINPTPVSKEVFKKKFDFTDRDYVVLPELDGFVCEPEHLNYQQIIGAKWNTYSQIDMTASPGEWPTIRKLINHLYGSNEVEPLDQTEELYDYHTVMLKHPKQKQYARILFSHAQGTSKSTLGALESMLFGENLSKIRDNEFESTFNSIWVSALILWLDEPSFENPRKMSRIIRDLVTAPVMNLRKMQSEYLKTNFCGKFLITTNDTNFMPLQRGDRRYWVREICKFQAEDEDAMFLEKMTIELQHYRHFLLNRQMKYPQKVDKTFWLPSCIIETNGFKKLVGDSASPCESAVIEILEQYLIKNKGITEVKFRLKDMKSLVADKLEVQINKVSDLDVVVSLRDVLGLEQPLKNSRPKKYEYVLSMSLEKDAGKWWTVNRENPNLQTELEEDAIFESNNIGVN